MRKWTNAYVYIDDILVYVRSELDHVWDQWRALEKLRQHKKYANAEKNELSPRELEFLGYILSGEGIRPDPKKIQSIREWQVPGTQKNVRFILGLANYYQSL